ncbi:MAG: hypothetical protein V8S22_09500 [Lachnospiraceae bacterium]
MVTEKETEKETEKVTEKKTEKETEAGFVFEGEWDESIEVSGSNSASVGVCFDKDIDKDDILLYSVNSNVSTSMSKGKLPSGITVW